MKKAKRRLWCKRNVIIALIVAIVGSISAYFFISCGQHDFDDNPDVEYISNLYSTALPTPNDGSNPSTHDPKENVFYAIYAMDKLDSFTTESSGSTVTFFRWSKKH